MSRYYGYTKPVAEDYKSLNIKDFKKWGSIEHNISGNVYWKNNSDFKVFYYFKLTDTEKHVQIWYFLYDDKGKEEKILYTIPLTTLNCYFGGRRFYFECPCYLEGKYCGRRVTKLYKVGKYFGCRHCFNLTYASRNENRNIYKKHPVLKFLDYRMELNDECEKYLFYNGKPTRRMFRREKLMGSLIDLIPAVKKQCDKTKV